MTKTLRLLMPQWQGGNNTGYYLGAELLSWLAPNKNNQKEIRVSIEAPNGKALQKENGVYGQSILLKQLESAEKIINDEQPDKIIVFGGDCLVDQAPFHYLHEKYKEELGIIWIDAHPDISTPELYHNEHAMVLGNLLGKGDPIMSKHVTSPINPKSVLYVGLQEPLDNEKKILSELNIEYTIQTEAILDADSINKWIKENNFKYIAIHLDLDVLNPHEFRSLLFSNPHGDPIDSPHGLMSLKELSTILTRVSEIADIVGLGIAEYIPWDVINLKNILNDVAIFNS